MKLYLGNKVLLGFILSFVVVALLGTASFIYIRDVVELSREMSQTQREIMLVGQIGKSVSRLENEALKQYIGKRTAQPDEYLRMKSSLKREIEDLASGRTSTAANSGAVEQLDHNIRRLVNYLDPLTDAPADGPQVSVPNIASLNEITKETEKLLATLRSSSDSLRREQQAGATSQFYQFIFISGALLTAALLLPLGLIFILNNTLKTRSATEARLVRASEEAKDLYESAPCGYFSVSKDGVISDVNHTLLKWLGYRKQQVVNHFSVDRILTGGARLFDASNIEQMTNDQIADLELEMLAVNGHKVPVLVSTRIAAGIHDNENYARCSVIDITGLRKAEQETRRLNQELEAFSYSVSHDLRAPLRSINGYAQILKEDYQDKLGTGGAEVIDVISRNASAMDQLINDLLQFSRIGREGVHKAPTNMYDLVKAISDELLAAESGRDIQVDNTVKGTSDVDVRMFRQVWINLISNALKYSKKKDKTIINIGSEANEDGIVYFIKDNGAGFDMAYSDKLFTAFQRLHKSKDFEGTGIGLAFVKRIIEKHGGTIWAESKVGEGAAFFFKLPVTQVR